MKPKQKKKVQQPRSAEKQQAKKVVKPESRKYYLALFIILLISFFAYLPVFHNGFVNWDDNAYIQNNPLLNHIDLKEIFSRFDLGNYHPLTMLVYSIEYHFFKVNAGNAMTYNQPRQ